ncbi:CpaF family protein [Roseiflexus castenholzii]|uniref:Type II secretion system protein E n=1 Tax=Roseiflexus castenholzii (strain DSM 13941 / HLO8) TaxID=383372 RepID=A7NRJ0_ROSCS|nr:CpaF family protein [Roseiflexus castenholzii]ABU60186.1 type II secretion system protein E [Roseiflexus castenholzii DSM 13941]
MNRFRFSRSGANNAQQSANASPFDDLRSPVESVRPVAPRSPVPPSLHDDTRDERDLIEAVQSQLINETDTSGRREPEYYARRIAELVTEHLEQSGRVVSERERNRLIRLAQSELLGLGPLEPLLADDTVSEIMVNGPHQIWIERNGKLQETDARFIDEDHVRRIIDRIISPLGRRCDETTPMVDARLPDGSRVNAIIPPLAINGSTITIRKFSRIPLTATDLITRGTASPELMELLRACVLGRLNCIVAGGTGTGKTTMLNVLSSFIPDDERIITIENAAELQLQQRHVVTLESRPANIEGRGEVTMRDLVVNALRMRPDRIVVGECRAGEALDMLQAMNTGHDGSMTTLHANSPRDALRRMETMVMMAGMDLPLRAIREQIASAIHVIIQLERLQDGSRKIVQVCEVTGMENDVVSLSDLFVFQQQGVRDGKVVGRIVPTGIRPRFLEKLQQMNITLSPQVFGAVIPGVR